MSYKDVLRVFKLERELTDDETATLNTLRKMSSADIEATVEAFGGSMGKVGKGAVSKQQRKIEHCDVDDCGLTKRAAIHKDATLRGFHAFLPPQPGKSKSARASSLAEKLQKPLGQGVKADEYGGFADDTDMQRCVAMIDDNGGEMECGKPMDDNIHHRQTDPNYHPFVPAAQDADELSSPTNGSSEDGQLSTASSEVEKESASTATGG